MLLVLITWRVRHLTDTGLLWAVAVRVDIILVVDIVSESLLHLVKCFGLVLHGYFGNGTVDNDALAGGAARVLSPGGTPVGGMAPPPGGAPGACC